MDKTIQEKIAESYKLIMWGVLLSAAHIIIGRFQILPAFVGHFLILYGINKLCNEVKIEYFKEPLKTARVLLLVSLIYWVWGAFIVPYTDVLTGCIEILVFVLEIAVFGDLLNKSVKLLKENDKVKHADKMRKNRMTFIKMYLGAMIIFAVSLIPVLEILRVYAAPTLMLGVKIFLSLLIQNVANSNVVYDATKSPKEIKE